MPITLVREAVVCYRRRPRRIEEPIRDPAKAARFIRDLVGNESREHFVAILLDGRHRPIGFQVVSIGTATSSLVHPREVFQVAVGLGAVALIVAHNHPSGDPNPSAEDLSVTERLRRAGELLGIPLLDSIVVGGSGYHSMRESSPDLFERRESSGG